jgi:hypothetical protein
MVFEKLADKLSPFLLDEKYYSYSVPTKKTNADGALDDIQAADTNKYMMYDFYVLDYLNFLVEVMTPKQFRDLNPDMEASVKDAVKKLFPHLREELLNSVFYAICAEMRNTTSMMRDYMTFFPKGSRERKLYYDWLKYMRIHRKSGGDKSYNDEDIEVMDVEKPSSDVRTPELEKDNSEDRNLSFKAANYAIKKNGVSRKEFIDMATEMFYNGNWSSSYGGPAWGRIGKGWQSLNMSDQLTPRKKQAVDSPVKPMSVAIDHVYDLQHNTDTVFNKLKSYYSPKSGYSWLKKALDHKANVKSYHDLLGYTSGSVKSMALPVLYNRLGTTWEQNLRENRPDDLYDHAKAAQKEKDDEQEAMIQANMKLAQQQAADLQAKKKPISMDDAFSQVTTQNPFKVGDKIKCIKSDGQSLTDGKEYKVESISDDLVYVMNDMGFYTEYLYPRFEKVGDGTEANDLGEHNVKVGDLITCVYTGGKSNSLTIGKSYKVTNTYNTTVAVIDDDNSEGNYYYTRFTKAEPAKKDSGLNEFNVHVGDMIECIRPGEEPSDLTAGKLYQVVSTQEKTVSVKDDTGETGAYYYKRFKKPETATDTTGLFTPQEMSVFEDLDVNSKIGDPIVCMTNKGNEKYLTVGKTYTISGISDGMVKIEDDGDIGSTYNTSRFKKAPAETTEHWKIGDILKCINNKNGARKELDLDGFYKIFSDPTKGKLNNVYVKITDRNGYVKGSFKASRFENVTLKKKKSAKDALASISAKLSTKDKSFAEVTYEVGDKVKCVNPGVQALTAGKIYTVLRFNKSNNNIVVVNDIGEKTSYMEARFKKVTEATKVVKSPGTFTPVAEMEKKYGFKVGDYVKHKTSGFEGKVVKFFDHHGEDGIDVEFDDGDKASWKAENVSKKEFPEKHNITGNKDVAFKRGDMVECLASGGNYDITVGKVYKVHRYYEINGKYYVEISKDNGNKDDFFADRFKKVPDTTPKKPRTFKDKVDDDTIKVGDMILHTQSNGLTHEGKVEKISDHVYLVFWPDINVTTLVPKGADVKKKPIQPEHKPFKVGDTVSVYSKLTDKTWYGTINNIDHPNKEASVNIPHPTGTGSHSEWFTLDQLKHDIKI